MRRHVLPMLAALLAAVRPSTEPADGQIEQREIGPQRDARMRMWMRIRLETLRNRYRDAKSYWVTVHLENRTQERRKTVNASA